MPPIRDIALTLPCDLLSGFALLTRLPLPNHQGTGARSAWAWPLVGAVLGAFGAALASGALWLGVTPGVTAVLVLALGAMLTGGLHEDGLSDTADGLHGGWTKARRLEIMKDSRVGSYGVLILTHIFVTMPLVIAIMSGFFEGLPEELEESAMIDGCTRFGALRRIILPLTLPGMAATLGFVFTAAWSELLFALMLINSEEKMTFPVGLLTFVSKFAKIYATEHSNMISPFWLHHQISIEWKQAYSFSTKNDDITVVAGLVLSTTFNNNDDVTSFVQKSRTLMFDPKNKNLPIYTNILDYFKYLLYVFPDTNRFIRLDDKTLNDNILKNPSVLEQLPKWQAQNIRVAFPNDFLINTSKNSPEDHRHSA